MSGKHLIVADKAVAGGVATLDGDVRLPKAQGPIGTEGFFLTPQGAIGTGAGWADFGLIASLPVLDFAANATERGIFMFFAIARAIFTTVDPEVRFVTYSRNLPVSGSSDDIRWRLTCKYVAVGEQPNKASDQVIAQTQTFTTLTASARQADLVFTLDRALISIGDVIFLNLERVGGDAADNYSSDAAIGQSGALIEVQILNP
jgi:hypothetical protein